MKRWFFICVTMLGSGVLAQSSEEPPAVEIRDVKCPYPWCDTCRWEVLEKTNLVESPRSDHIVGEIGAGEISSELVRAYTTPERGTALFDHPPIKTGDTFYLMGEGPKETLRVWHHGVIHEMYFNYSPPNQACNDPDKNCWWRMEDAYVRPEIWLKVKPPKGHEGWVNEDKGLICVGNGND